MSGSQRICFKIEEFSRFERSVKEQRSSEPVLIQQLAWKIVAKCQSADEGSGGVRYLGCYVKCNAQDYRISDWNCVADVALQLVPRQKNVLPVQEKYVGQQFSDENKCCGNSRMVTMEQVMNSENGWYNKEQDNIILEAIITARSPYFQFYNLPMQQNSVIPIYDINQPEGRISLKIEKLSEFAQEDDKSRISEAMHVRGLSWKIIAISFESDQTNHFETAGKYLGFLVQCNADDSAEVDWSCAGSFRLRIIAQKKEKADYMRKFTHTFQGVCTDGNVCGIAEYITFEELMDPENGWYDEKKDTVILSADVTADAPYGIKNRTSLASRMLYLLNSGKKVDVHFLVGTEEDGKKRFTAHKGILSTFSDVFDKMFDFDSICSNSDKVIEIPDVKPEAFRVMLNFIYTTCLDGLNQENMFDILHAAKKYNIADLVDACAYCPKLDVNNVLCTLGKAIDYDVKNLIDRCWKFIDRNATDVLKSPKFMEIDQKLLCDLFARKQLVLQNREIVIWNAALRWADAECKKRNMDTTGDNCRKLLGPALFKIRFPLIPKEHFVSIIVPTKVLTKDEVIGVLSYHAYPEIMLREYPLKFSRKTRSS